MFLAEPQLEIGRRRSRTVMTRKDSSNRVPACLKCHNEVSQPPFYEVTEGSKIKGCQEDTADPQLCRAKHVEVEAIQIDGGMVGGSGRQKFTCCCFLS